MKHWRELTQNKELKTMNEIALKAYQDARAEAIATVARLKVVEN